MAIKVIAGLAGAKIGALFGVAFISYPRASGAASVRSSARSVRSALQGRPQLPTRSGHPMEASDPTAGGAALAVVVDWAGNITHRRRLRRLLEVAGDRRSKLRLKGAPRWSDNCSLGFIWPVAMPGSRSSPPQCLYQYSTVPSSVDSSTQFAGTLASVKLKWAGCWAHSSGVCQ